jgi:hypothetical protein
MAVMQEGKPKIADKLKSEMAVESITVEPRAPFTLAKSKKPPLVEHTKQFRTADIRAEKALVSLNGWVFSDWRFGGDLLSPLRRTEFRQQAQAEVPARSNPRRNDREPLKQPPLLYARRRRLCE